MNRERVGVPSNINMQLENKRSYLSSVFCTNVLLFLISNRDNAVQAPSADGPWVEARKERHEGSSGTALQCDCLYNSVSSLGKLESCRAELQPYYLESLVTAVARTYMLWLERREGGER